jgi:hypothetical protein
MFRCSFHNHPIFDKRNLKETLKTGLNDNYDKIVSWIRNHPENIRDGSAIEQDYYGCGTDYSSEFIILTYLKSLDKDSDSCIISHEEGKW